MDLQTLTIILIIANVVQALVLLMQYRVNQTHSGPGWWSLGSGFVALGFFFHSLRVFPSLEHTAIIVNNMLFFSGLALLYTGVLRFLGKQERVRWLVLFGSVFTLLIMFFTFVSNDLNIRRLLISTVVSVLSFLIAHALFTYKPRSLNISAHFLITVFLANGLFFLARGISTFPGSQGYGILAASTTQVVTYVASLIFSSLWTFGFIIMVNQRLHAESQDAAERFTLIFNTSPDAVLLTRMTDGHFIDINEGFSAMTGYTRAEVLGKTSLDLNLWHDLSRRQKVFDEIGRKGFCENVETIFQLKDGRRIFGMLSAKIVTLQEEPHILSVTRDITERKKLEAALTEREAHYRLLTEDVSDVVWKLDSNYHFTYISPADERLRGYRADEVVGRHVFELMTDDGIATIKEKSAQRIAAEQNGETINQLTFEVQQRCKDGTLVWTEILSTAERGPDGSITGFHGITRNISEHKQAELLLADSYRKVEALSITDGLTGIANRRHFDEVLDREYARHIRSGADLSLILLDIDHFKAFNDNYGHVKGDECLRQIGRVLTECCTRAADLAARFGGEEFVCILPETDDTGALVIAEQLRCGIHALALPHSGSRVAKFVTASMGVLTVQCSEAHPVVDILAQVDELLYKAKHAGRDRIEVRATRRITEVTAGKSRENFVQLVWNSSYNSGNPLIDAQHKSLLNSSNTLLEAVLSGRPSAEISLLIDQLLTDVTQHFHDEQAILQSIGYPGIDKHIEEHAGLLSKGFDLSQQFNASSLTVGDIFQYLAYDVVMLHMLRADRDYFRYLNNASTV